MIEYRIDRRFVREYIRRAPKKEPVGFRKLPRALRLVIFFAGGCILAVPALWIGDYFFLAVLCLIILCLFLLRWYAEREGGVSLFNFRGLAGRKPVCVTFAPDRLVVELAGNRMELPAAGMRGALRRGRVYLFSHVAGPACLVKASDLSREDRGSLAQFLMARRKWKHGKMKEDSGG